MATAIRFRCRELRLQMDGSESIIFDDPTLVDAQAGESYIGYPTKTLKLPKGHIYETGKHYDFAIPTVAVEDYPPPEEPVQE